MDIKEIIEQLEYQTGEFPEKALIEAIKKQDEITPALIKVLEDASENVKRLSQDKAYFGHIYAMFLLAQFREKRAFNLIIRLVSHERDLLYDLIGDVLTEDLGRILASVSCDDISLIKKVIENTNLDVYVRGAGIDALLSLFVVEVISRGKLIEYFKELYQKAFTDYDEDFLLELVASSNDIHPAELYNEIKKTFDLGAIPEYMISLEDIKRTLKQDKEEVVLQLKNRPHYHLVADVVEEIKWWACFTWKKPEL